MHLNNTISGITPIEMPITSEFEMPQADKMRILKHFGQTPHAANIINQITELSRRTGSELIQLRSDLPNDSEADGNEFKPEMLSSTLTDHFIEQGRLRWQLYNFIQEKPENAQVIEQGLVDFMSSRQKEHESAGIDHSEIVDATNLHSNSIVSDLSTRPEFEFHDKPEDDEARDLPPKNSFAQALATMTQLISGRGLQTAEGPMINMNVTAMQSGRTSGEKPLIENSKARILIGSLGTLLEGAAIVTTYLGLSASDAGIKIPQLAADLVRGGFAVGAQVAESTGIFLIAALITKFKNAATAQEKIYIGTGILSAFAVFTGFSILDIVTGYSEASSIGLTHEVMKYILPTLGFFAPFAINVALGNIKVQGADNIGAVRLPSLPHRSPNLGMETQLNNQINAIQDPALKAQFQQRLQQARGDRATLQQIYRDLSAQGGARP